MTKNNRKWQGIVGVLVLAVSSASITACGKGGNQLVQDVKLRTHQKDDGLYIEVRALLETLNLNFGGQLPIVDPRKPDKVYGTISLNPAFGTAGSELVINVNLTQVKLGTTVDGRYLPNGSLIPVSTGEAAIFALRAGKNSIVYVALGGNTAMVGTALTIKEFDQVSRYAPGVNIFPGFNLGNGVRGVAGIFTGAQTMQSGIALFVDASSTVVPPQMPESLGGSAFASVARVDRGLHMQSAVTKSVPSGLKFKEGRASVSTENRVLYEVMRVGDRGRRLRLQ